MSSRPFLQRIDWATVILYLTLVLLGWLNIYAAVYNEQNPSILDLSQRYGSQLLWIITALAIAAFILLVDNRVFTDLSYAIYGGVLLLLAVTLMYGAVVHGSKSWLAIGPLRVQPAEFAKFATLLALAKCMGHHTFSLRGVRGWLRVLLILGLPVGLILLQNDFGSALVYSSFLILLYREGMHPSVILLLLLVVAVFIVEILWDRLYILLGFTLLSLTAIMVLTRQYRQTIRATLLLLAIFALLYLLNQWLSWGWPIYYLALSSAGAMAAVGLLVGIFKGIKCVSYTVGIFMMCVAISFSVDYVMANVLSPHHQRRIYDLLGVEDDRLGWGYNVNQSKIAIGSGGILGKGYLEGTQTKFNFVPEQSTDFIFCTVGEEWGFMGSLLVIGLFVLLLLRLIRIAERQKDTFSRVYGYGVMGILFFHFAVNIAMTVGLFPVIGIPLPFFSYGGSSLWAFTILLFILIKLDASRLTH